MKPFSKFAALSGEAVVTREGKPVTQIKEFEVQDVFRVVGAVAGYNVQMWTDDGRYLRSGLDSEYDLFMAPKVAVGWVAFGNRAPGFTSIEGFCTHVWKTEAEAHAAFMSATQRMPRGTLRVEWEVE